MQMPTKQRRARAKRVLLELFRNWNGLPPQALAERLEAVRKLAFRRLMHHAELCVMQRMTARLHALRRSEQAASRSVAKKKRPGRLHEEANGPR
jgi:hypothetical protein